MLVGHCCCVCTYNGDNFDFPVLLVHALQFAGKMQSAELIGQFVDFGAKRKQVFGLLWGVKGMGSASSGHKASGFELLGFLNISLRVCNMVFMVYWLAGREVMFAVLSLRRRPRLMRVLRFYAFVGLVLVAGLRLTVKR